MEDLLWFNTRAFEDALLVHIHELLLSYLLVEMLVDFPDHQLDFPVAQLHVHLLQHFFDVLDDEVSALMLCR